VSPESWLKESSVWKVIPPFLNSSFVARFRSRLAVDASINPKIVDLPPRDECRGISNLKEEDGKSLSPSLANDLWMAKVLSSCGGEQTFQRTWFWISDSVSFFDLLNVSQLLSSLIPCLLPTLTENLFAVAAPCHPQGTVWSF
jgi:hypothetical protein